MLEPGIARDTICPLPVPKVVLDTNVLIAALRSRRGASFALLELVGTGVFDLVLSVPLVLEYEDAALRGRLALSAKDVAAVIDYLCAASIHQPIYFLWRPFVPDPKDDMVAEVAFGSSADFLVTHNLRDFRRMPELGVTPTTPAVFLRKLRHP